MEMEMEMEWNGKWDWENLIAFGSKVIESPKNLQLADWTMVDDDDDDDGDTFNLSASDGSSHPSSTDSSSKDENGNGNGMHTPIFKSSGNLSVQLSGASPAPDTTSVCSAEALLGLKLGKRTYFENTSCGAKTTSFSVIPTPPTITPNKTKSSSAHNSPACCQVEGCNVDLSLAKEYHRKHRVCDTHSKCPKVIVGGRERRFCQQCSRFHSLSEFDEKKRSCRRRLSDHNARRRKPHQETIQFNSPGLSTPFYGGTQQMSFLLNNSAVVHSRIPATTSGWNNFTPAKGCSIKFEGDGVIDQRLHMQGMRLPQPINMLNGLSASKDTPSVVFNPGSKGSLISSSVDAAAAAENGRALSLLSSNSWDESSIQFHHHQLHENSPTSNISIRHHHPMIYEGVPSSSSEFWPTPHNVQSLAHSNRVCYCFVFSTEKRVSTPHFRHLSVC